MKRGFWLFLLGCASGTAQAGAPPADRAIVVTGTPLPVTELRLAQCLARHCPPDEDIAASLAHAENLFVAGRYREARGTTRASLGRNQRFAADYPIAVSGLYRADGRLSAHLGDGGGFYYSAFGVRKALKTLPNDAPPRLAADIELGDMLVSLGSTERARPLYRAAASKAARAGRNEVAALARVRLAWIDSTTGYQANARRALTEIAGHREAEMVLPRLMALALLARFDRMDHRPGSSDALIEEIRRASLPQPVVLFSPPVDVSRFSRLSGNAEEPYWADIGFIVSRDGLVGEVEMLRGHGRLDWVPAVVKSIEGRVYAPAGANGQGSYRVERFSYTAFVTDNQDSTSRRPIRGPPRLEMLDLTTEPAPAGS